MDSRKRLRLDDVMTMLDTEDDFDEPMEVGSDDEFPDMVMSIMERTRQETVKRCKKKLHLCVHVSMHLVATTIKDNNQHM